MELGHVHTLAAIQLGQQSSQQQVQQQSAGTQSQPQCQQQQHQHQQTQHQSFSHPAGFASLNPTTAAFPPQMAAAIGLLGGYNTLVKELTGGEAQLPTQSGLAAYQHGVRFTPDPFVFYHHLRA
ncbi:unnamed protein product [Echinostoma caproni]|uniref:Mediator of RNA polymerase II transcription subunit 6 n=1 Tax=Echinostoma caproni TaxID=27848 RepID=A0A183BBS4_9TREM|nr:unnamed protein product [Echinostoma caproni]